MREKKEILNSIHTTFCRGMVAGKTKEAKDWLESKNLSIELTGVCFSSGQLHHRKQQSFLDELVSIGFLNPSDVPTSTGKQGYNSFGKEAIVFPLKNDRYEVVNFFGIRINIASQTSEYLNDEGIYPCYPHVSTKKLYITDTIIDAATLLESKLLDSTDAVMALHHGELKEQHIKAIEQLHQLEHIIFITNN